MSYLNVTAKRVESVKMYYSEGLTAQEVAERTGSTPAAVRAYANNHRIRRAAGFPPHIKRIKVVNNCR